jgi:hypothetical protein
MRAGTTDQNTIETPPNVCEPKGTDEPLTNPLPFEVGKRGVCRGKFHAITKFVATEFEVIPCAPHIFEGEIPLFKKEACALGSTGGAIRGAKP